MSQDANQPITTPELEEINSSTVESSDQYSTDTVEQGDADEVATVAGDASGPEQQEDAEPLANIHLPSSGTRVEGRRSVEPIIEPGRDANYQQRMEAMFMQMTQMMSQLMKERERDAMSTAAAAAPEKDAKKVEGLPLVEGNEKKGTQQQNASIGTVEGQVLELSVLKSTPSSRSGSMEESLDSVTQLKKLCSDIKRKEFDIEKIMELPYVQAQRPDIEKAFMNYYNELSSMEHRSLAQSDDLTYFDVGKFPKYNSVKTIPGLLVWLKRMLHYKNAHCIPDYLIRSELETAASGLSDPQVEAVVATAVEDAKLGEHEPIKYARLLSYLEIRKPKVDYNDFLLLIDKAFKSSSDVRVLMVILGNTIDSYVRRQNIKDIPKLSWIKIIRKLYRVVPEAMTTIEFQIPSTVKIRYRGEDGKFYEKVVDGDKTRRELSYISHRLEKEISKAPFISDDLSITWHVIMVTYDRIVEGIPLEIINEKSKTTTQPAAKGKDKLKCKACGKGNHTIQNCFTLKKMISNEKIEEKDGKYFDKATGKEIVVKDDETIVSKYNSDRARPKQH